MPRRFLATIVLTSCVAWTAGAQTSPLALLTDPDAIETTVRGLSDAEITNLQNKHDRFEKLSPEEQTRMRKLHRELASHDRAKRLHQVMQKYQQWLKSLSDSERSRLLDLPPAERIEQIKKLKVEQDRKWLREYGSELRTSDIRALSQFIQEYTEQHKPELSQIVPEFARSRLRDIRSPIMRSFAFWSMATRSGEPLPKPSEQEWEKLTQSLSQAARTQLAKATTDEDKFESVHAWFRTIIMRPDRLESIPKKELEDFFFNELTPEERDELRDMAPDEMQRNLRMLYVRQLGGRYGRGGGRRGPGGRGGRNGSGPGNGRGRGEREPFDRDGRRPPPRFGDPPPDDGPFNGPPNGRRREGPQDNRRRD
ncbi:MAG: hypothetical protein AAF497_14650 [Planctomycetota bacterium]